MDTLRAPHPLHASHSTEVRDVQVREPVPPDAAEVRHRHPRHRHRWVVATIAIAAGLLVYGAGLGWFANRLADDLTATIQPIPALEDQQHRSD